MTETLETPDSPTTVIDRRPNRVNQAAAWVAIVAGVVFVVGSIFFTGFFLGRHSGGPGGHAGGKHHGGPSVERLMPMPGMGPGMMPPPPPGSPTTVPSPPPGR